MDLGLEPLVPVQIALSDGNTCGCALGVTNDQKLALDFNAHRHVLQVAVSGLSGALTLALIACSKMSFRLLFVTQILTCFNEVPICP